MRKITHEQRQADRARTLARRAERHRKYTPLDVDARRAGGR